MPRRAGELRRRTPLQQGDKPLQRGSGPARTPMGHKPSRKRRESTRAMAELWPLLYERTGGFCECCGEAFTDVEPMQAHHRWKRSQGGPDALSNFVGLRRTCHHYGPHSPHAAPEAALMRGYTVRRGQTPAEVPLWHAGAGGWVLLHDDGTMTQETQ